MNEGTAFFPELCARVECDHGAHCMAGVCVCPDECPESSGEPVCGSDAKTYPSECELQKAACGRDPKLPVLHVIFYGDCSERFAVAALSKILLSFPFSITNHARPSKDSKRDFPFRINVARYRARP